MSYPPAHPSVHVCLSLTYGLGLAQKQKALLQGRSNWCAKFQLKKSKFDVRISVMSHCGSRLMAAQSVGTRLTFFLVSIMHVHDFSPMDVLAGQAKNCRSN